MNKIYKVIWNAAVGAFVVVSELSKAKTKVQSQRLGAASATAISALTKAKIKPLAVLVAAMLPASSLYAAIAIDGITDASGKNVAYNSGTSHAATLYGAGSLNYGNPGNLSYTDPQKSESLHSPSSALAEGIAIGRNAISGTIANNIYATGIAIGDYAKASGGLSFAIGSFAQGLESGSTAIGTSALASGFNSLAMMRQSAATNDYAMAIGTVAYASGKGSLAMGQSSTASGKQSIAIGSADVAPTTSSSTRATKYDANTNTEATGDYATAIGSQAEALANNTLALGTKSMANAEAAIALGSNSSASVNGSVALGEGSKATTDKGVAGFDPLTRTAATATDSVWKSTSGAIAVGSSADSLSRQITGVAAGSSDSDAVNVAQLKNAMTLWSQSGLNFEGNQGGSIHKDPAQTLKISGDLANTAAASANNVRVDVTSGDLVVKISESPLFTSVTANNSLSVNNGPALTSSGINVANKQITNVSNATSTSDAVNLAQLNSVKDIAMSANTSALSASRAANAANTDAKAANSTANALSATINKGISFQGDVGEPAVRKFGETVTLNGDNYLISTQSFANGTIEITSDPNLTNAVSKANSALQSFTTTVDTRNTAQTITQQGNNANFITGKNMQLSASNRGITIATKDDVTFTTVNATNVNADTATIGSGSLATTLTSTADGLNVGGRKITHIANGTQDSDAVNLSQLNATNENVANLSKSVANISSNTQNIEANTQNISKNADEIAKNAANITASKEAIDKGINFGNGTAANNYKLGDTISLSSDSNLVVETVADGVKLALANNINLGSLTVADTFKAGNVTINAQGIDAGNQAISNVANGTQDSDAVNLGQLNATNTAVADNSKAIANNTANITANQEAIAKNVENITANTQNITQNAADIAANQQHITQNTADITANKNAIADNAANLAKGWNLTTSGNATGSDEVKVAMGDLVTLDGGENIQLTQAGKKVTIATSMNPTFTTVTAKERVTIGTTNLTSTADGLDVGGDKVTNITSGAVTADSKEAINGSQLFNAANATAAALGTTVNPITGELVAPSYNIYGSNVNNVAEALKGLQEKSPVTYLDSAGNASNVPSNSVALRGADAAKPVSLTNVASGVVKADSLDAVNGGQLFAQGEGVKNLLGGNTTYDPATGAYANNDIGGTGKATLDEAIKAANNAANQGWNLTANNGQASSTVKPGNAVDLNNSDNNIVISKAGHNVTFDLAKDLKVSSVTTGNTQMNDDGISIANGAAGKAVSLSKNGLDNGGNKLANLANGEVSASSSDAVNGSQLHSVANSVANVLGGDAKLAANGDISMTNIGNTGANTINEAIASVGSQATKAKTTVTAGKNVIVTTSANADGSTNYEVANQDEVAFNKVQVGDISVSAVGINAGATQITNVKSGLDGRNIEAIKAEGDKSAQWNNVATIGDVATVQGNVNNVANTVLGAVGTNVQGDVVEYVTASGELTEEGKKLLTTYDVAGRTATDTNNVLTAINNMNEGGIKYFHTNDQNARAASGVINNTGDSSAAGAFSTAIGYQATANAENAIALGKDAQALNVNTISIGNGNIVRGLNSGAIGDPSIIDGNNSYSVGNNNTVATNNTFVLGNEVTKTMDNSVILGNGSEAVQVNTAAQSNGTYSYKGENDANVAGVNDVVGVVSVGNSTQTRQVQGVAAGVVSANSTDAVNGSQLYHTHQAIEKVAAGGAGAVQYSSANNPTVSNGGVASNDVTLVGGNANAPVALHNVAAGKAATDAVNVAQLNDGLGKVNNRVSKLDKRVRGIGANAAAAASLPQVYTPGKSMLAAAGGSYSGASAVAIGYSRASDNGKIILKATGTANSAGHYSGGIGIGYQW